MRTSSRASSCKSAFAEITWVYYLCEKCNQYEASCHLGADPYYLSQVLRIHRLSPQVRLKLVHVDSIVGNCRVALAGPGTLPWNRRAKSACLQIAMLDIFP